MLIVVALSFVATQRLYLNRASGGRLASLWELGENEGGHDGTQDWLPDWILLSALSDTLRSIVGWMVSMWNGPRLLNHLENNAQRGDPPSRESRIALANLQLQPENILLVMLVSLLLVVLVIRRRRPWLRL